MANNKIQLSDGTVLLDLTADTVTSAAHIKLGLVAHIKDGSVVEGTLVEKDVKTVAYSIPKGASAAVQTSEVVTGQAYCNRLKASAGYNIDSVVVTMGGVDITSQVFSGDTGESSGGGSTTPTLQSKTATPSETAQTITADSGYDGLSSVEVGAISSTYVGSGIIQRDGDDLTTSGATVTVPAGYYASQATKSVASGSAGTPTAAKGTVSNHSVTVTPSVTNTTGYITGGTKNGTAVTVSASELVSGSQTITANGTVDVTNLASVDVNISFANIYTGTGEPSSSTGSAGDIYIRTAAS